MSIQISHALAHLRFPFSLFLLPVYLFALSGIDRIDWMGAALAFVVLHFLIYPASNGYNSLMDRDEGSIGGLEKPPKAPAILFPITLGMDVLGILITSFWSPAAAVVLVFYILASKAYSWRRIRLKKLPWIGFLVVVIFQGAAVYYFSICMADPQPPPLYDLPFQTLLGLWISILLIASSYPLTQVYQHRQDAADKVHTLSMSLGIKGTFKFSMVMLIFFILLLFGYLGLYGRLFDILIFLAFTTPATVHFFSWYRHVLIDPKKANFKNSMKMSLLGAIGMNMFFLYLLAAAQIF